MDQLDDHEQDGCKAPAYSSVSGGYLESFPYAFCRYASLVKTFL